MHLLVHLWSDSFHITHISSLGVLTFGLCSALRYGVFWRFGDLFQFRQKMVMYIVTQVIMINITIVVSTEHEVSENYPRVRISEITGWQRRVCTAFCRLLVVVSLGVDYLWGSDWVSNLSCVRLGDCVSHLYWKLFVMPSNHYQMEVARQDILLPDNLNIKTCNKTFGCPDFFFIKMVMVQLSLKVIFSWQRIFKQDSICNGDCKWWISFLYSISLFQLFLTFVDLCNLSQKSFLKLCIGYDSSLFVDVKGSWVTVLGQSCFCYRHIWKIRYK